MFTRIGFVFVWLCAVVILDAAKFKSRAESDPKFDFRQVKTWGWDRDKAGDVIIARASTDDPAQIKQRVDPVIVDAVSREIVERGLPRVAEGQPDLLMHYYLLVTVGTNAQEVGGFLPAIPYWGLPPFAPATTSLNIVERGSLVLDAQSSSLGKVVWRGVSQGDIDKIQSTAERDAAIREIARDLVRKMPIKK